MPGVVVDGNDVIAVYEAAKRRSIVPGPVEDLLWSNAKPTATGAFRR